MELTFLKSKTKSWVAEFEATADFNLHIERVDSGDISVFMKTSGEKYSRVEEFDRVRGASVLDYDFVGIIYPKQIKIVSETEPTYATVLSEGDVNIDGGGSVGGDTIMYYTCLTSDAPDVIVNLDTLDTIQPWGEVGIEETPMGLHPTMMPSPYYPRLAFLNVDVTVALEDGRVLEPSPEGKYNLYYIPVDSLPITVKVKNNGTGKEYKIYIAW